MLDGMEISTLSSLPFVISNGLKGDKYLLIFNINTFVENPEKIGQVNAKMTGQQANFVTMRVAIAANPDSEDASCFNKTVWTMPECICSTSVSSNDTDADIYILIEATFNFNQVSVTLEFIERLEAEGTDVIDIGIIDKSEQLLISTTNIDNNANAEELFIDHLDRNDVYLDNQKHYGLSTGVTMEFIMAWFAIVTIILTLWIISCKTEYMLKREANVQYDIKKIYL